MPRLKKVKTLRNSKESGYKYCALNREKLRIKSRLFRKNNPKKVRAYFKKWYKVNKKKNREYCKEYQKNNAGKCKEWRRKYRKENAEKLKKYMVKYHETNKKYLSEKKREYYRVKKHLILQKRKVYYFNNKEKVKTCNYKWRIKNIGKLRVISAHRWKSITRQSLFRKFKKELELIYFNRPDGLEVDHIIPLQGKGVCGLHVPWNLQYLSKSENSKKGNRLNP
jgi:5-methylcytosine-specific restriction endonuclease McrA